MILTVYLNSSVIFGSLCLLNGIWCMPSELSYSHYGGLSYGSHFDLLRRVND